MCYRTNKYYRAILIVLAVFLLPSILVFPITAQIEKPLLVMNLYGYFDPTVKTGQDNIIYMEVRNAGETTIHNITFSYLAPKGWTVTFNPANLSSLEAGVYQNIEVNVRPTDTDNRNNNITFVAQSNETSQTLNVFMVLESTNRTWLWLGIGLVVLAALIFLYLFRRLNRGQ